MKKLHFNWYTPLIIFICYWVLSVLVSVILVTCLSSFSNIIFNPAFTDISSKIVMLIILLITCKFFPLDQKILDLKLEPKKLLFITVIGIILFFVTHLIVYLTGEWKAPSGFFLTWTYILTAISACIFAPILEELLFRGVIYHHLQKKYPFWISATYSSVLFAIMHVEPVKMIFTFLIGMVLCWILNKENKIIYPIIIHALIAILNRIMGYLWS